MITAKSNEDGSGTSLSHRWIVLAPDCFRCFNRELPSDVTWKNMRGESVEEMKTVLWHLCPFGGACRRTEALIR